MNKSKSYDNLMDYPDSFKIRCLFLYPDNKRIEYLLSNGSYLLGDYLKSLIPNPTSSKDVFKAYKSGKMEKLVQKQISRDSKIELYLQFLDLYEKQYLSKGKCVCEDGTVKTMVNKKTKNHR